jgi:soluble lytic murein transglycosylase
LLAWALSYPSAYLDAVSKASIKYNLQTSLIYAVMRTESSFHPSATSPAGAIGLMQLMPATAALMDKGKGNPADRLTQPEQNIKLGTRHLKDLLDLYKGEQLYAIAAYNAGAHNVDRWRKEIGQVPVDEFIERIPFGETRDYVKKVLAAATIYRRLYPTTNINAAPAPAAPVFSFYSSLNDD